MWMLSEKIVEAVSPFAHSYIDSSKFAQELNSSR